MPDDEDWSGRPPSLRTVLWAAGIGLCGVLVLVVPLAVVGIS